jgi:bacterioferritin
MSSQPQPQNTGTYSEGHQEIIAALSEQLNREVTTFLRYMVQGALVKGAQWENVRNMYLAEVTGEVGHAQYLSNKLVVLGVTPQLNPDLSTPPTDPAAMLRHDIDAESQDVANYMRLAELADKTGMIELKVQMEANAADEQHHAEEMTRLLG